MSKFKISDEKATQADFLVCQLLTDPLLMKGNLVGTCTQCFKAIQFRPHVPKEPKKICVECFNSKPDGPAELVISTITAAEVANIIRKKMN